MMVGRRWAAAEAPSLGRKHNQFIRGGYMKDIKHRMTILRLQMNLYCSRIADKLLRIISIKLLAGFIFIIAFILYSYSGLTPKDLYPNIITDLFFISFTILVVDVVYRRINDTERKTILIAQLGSCNKMISDNALIELKAHGWFLDGTLKKAFLLSANLCDDSLNYGNLSGAILDSSILQRTNWTDSDLENAHMTFCDLRGAVFTPREKDATEAPANMKGVSLYHSDLLGASISFDQFILLYSLWGARMPDGTRYDGRYNLQGDIEIHAKLCPNLLNTRDWANFYGVPESSYIDGQKWAEDHAYLFISRTKK
jgi:hypothetical protein